MIISSLIREFLLQEEVFGAQAFVYHGSKAPPKVMLPVFLKDKFTPGAGVGDMYGKGLYAVYDLAGSKTESGKTYGQYIYKLKVNLYGFISFDPDVTRKIYKRDLTPSQQAELVGADEDIIEKLKQFDNKQVPEFSSDWAESASKYLRGKVKGLVYTGRNDGRCIVLYDVSVAVPTAWKTVDDTAWTKVDRESMKPGLRRSSTGEWEKERYDIDLVVLLKRLEKLPIEKRIVKGNLDLIGAKIRSLPPGLKVEGDLKLNNLPITSLPAGLQVGGNLELSGAKITSLPLSLKVGGDLKLANSSIISLPTSLQVGGNLELSYTRITFFPLSLKVGGNLDLAYTLITSLPAGLKVGGDLHLIGTPIKSLPADLEVGGSLNLTNTKITSVPASVKVGGKIQGLKKHI